MFGKTIVDLSHIIDPQTEKRHVRVDYVELENYKDVFPGYVVTKADRYYPMHVVEFASHIGTHLETPYHWNRRGRDTANIPPERLVGDAVVLDLRHVPLTTMVSRADVQSAAETAGMRRGDMVFCNTGYRANDEKKAPFFSTEAVQWLVEQGMSLMAVEAEMEDLLRGDELEDFPNHAALFSKDVLLLEYVTNLEALSGPRFTAIALPIKIVGLDSCPVRVLAIQ